MNMIFCLVDLVLIACKLNHNDSTYNISDKQDYLFCYIWSYFI